MKQSTISKPAKPHPGFPLFPHATRRWAKKVRGKMHYFGPWDDPQGALAEWLRVKDDLLAGRATRPKTEGLPLRELLNRFLTAKQRLVDSGEIRQRSWDEYHASCERLVSAFGRDRVIADLAGDDFETHRANLAKKWNPTTLTNEIQRVRTVFKFAFDEGLIGRPVRFGSSFKKPSRRVMRVTRQEKGERMLEAPQIQSLLKDASSILRAMVLLGINGGFGNRDVGLLPLAALDLDGGWINFPRPKTGISRRVPLWPETVAALREVVANRPPTTDSSVSGLVFVTKYGGAWAKEQAGRDPVCLMFGRLLRNLKLHRPGIGFYALRHTFRTIADAARDQPAAHSIMGHADDTIDGHYRERIDDCRLRRVVDHVRGWLFVE